MPDSNPKPNRPSVPHPRPARVNNASPDPHPQGGKKGPTEETQPPSKLLPTATMADAAEVITGVKFLVKDWIPLGMVTGVIAQPGVGTSSFALWLARSELQGCQWFTGTKGAKPPRTCAFWVDTENSMAITMQRMKQWKIPLEKMVLPFENPLLTLSLTEPNHLNRVEQLIESYQLRLVVVDSLRGGHGGDENSSGVMSIVLQTLAGIAERTACAIVVIHHTRKLTIKEEISANSSRGSNAIFAMMRSQIGIDRPDPTAPRKCRVRVLKENLGIAPPPLGFEIKESGLAFGTPPTKPRPLTAQGMAENFLRAVMKPGVWTSSKKVSAEAEKRGISSATLQRAREKLGIVKTNIRESKNGTEWRLPG